VFPLVNDVVKLQLCTPSVKGWSVPGND